MNLVDLELGKWIYLIIYLFFPILTIIYLINTFGLKVKEDPLDTARIHIEQANYWADVAIQTAQSPNQSKSLTSLEYTVQNNLTNAVKLLVKADPNSSEVQFLNLECRQIEQKLQQIHMFMATPPPVSVSPSRQ